MSLAMSPVMLEGPSLTGPEKVATLLLAMGKPLATRLLKHFDPSELKIVTRAAAALKAVPTEALEGLVEELASDFTRDADLRGNVADVEHLLGGVLTPDQVAEIMADVRGGSNASIWVRLSALPENDLAAYLAKEHPQTAALVLSRLTPETAARVMAVVPREARHGLTRRMLGLRPVSETTLRILETKLRDDLLLNTSASRENNTQARIADILNRMEPDQAQEILGDIAETKPADAAILRSKMFSFADIVTLSVKARSVLFDKVPTEQVILALKGTDEAFREAVLSALGARARRLVENELKGDPGSQKEAAAARKSICAAVLDLIGRGEIEPPAPQT